MHAGRKEYIVTLDTYGIYHEIYEMGDAPHSFIFFNPWFEKTVAYIHRFLLKIGQNLSFFKWFIHSVNENLYLDYASICTLIIKRYTKKNIKYRILHPIRSR